MARRVKQADGTYCYTENCRIHDRSGDSTGLKAVLHDAKAAHAQVFADDTSQTLQSELKVPEEAAHRIGARAIETLMNSEGSVSAFDMAVAIKDASYAEGIDPSKFDIMPAAYAAHTALIQKAIIKPGDEVILNENGERGTIAEGNSGYGGAVRFNPESTRSRNSFSWFQPNDVTKIVANEKAPARMQITAMPRDELVPAKLIRQLFAEESSKTTPNAQAVKEFGRSGKAARENLEKFGNHLAEKFGDRGLTKHNLMAAIAQAYDKPVAREMPDAELKATKGGLRGILTYLDPTGDLRD